MFTTIIDVPNLKVMVSDSTHPGYTCPTFLWRDSYGDIFISIGWDDIIAYIYRDESLYRKYYNVLFDAHYNK